MSKYKGINLTKINGIQKINFPKTMTDSVSVRLDFEKFDTKALDKVSKCIQDHAEKLLQNQVEDTEMFIICEMAKMFLEEKEKWKRVIERLEEEKKFYNSASYTDQAIRQGVMIATEIVKEEGGMNEKMQ
jgi:predicted glutamine amidotransferase